MKLLQRSLVAGAAMGLLGSVGATSASAATSPTPSAPPSLQGPGVVHYSTANLTPRSTYEIVTGKRAPHGGCSYPIRLTVPAGSFHVDETASQPATCQAVMAVTPGVEARPTGSQSEPGGRVSTSTNGAVAASAAVDTHCQNPEDTSASGSYYTHNECYDTWSQDPIGIVLNGDTTEAQWSGLNNCADGDGAYASGQYNYFPDGWAAEDVVWAPEFNCTVVRAEYSMYFQNIPFCTLLLHTPQPPTYVFYSGQQVDGYFGGSKTFYVNWSVQGGCSYLVSLHSSSGGN